MLVFEDAQNPSACFELCAASR